MSKIDTKLKEILCGYAGKPDFENPQQKQLLESNIAQIKKAFADEGYIPYKPYYEIPEDQRKEAEWWSKTPTILTGQEWYDRFKVEFTKDQTVSYSGDMLAVAKRAAGIKND